MGEIADLILEGEICQECCQHIDNMPHAGHPRYCTDCGGDPQYNGAVKRGSKWRKKILQSEPDTKCPTCGKKLRGERGLKDHTNAGKAIGKLCAGAKA